MSRATNVHLPPVVRDERDVPTGVQGMTRHITKFNHWETLRAYEEEPRAYPWNDPNMRWDQDRYVRPQNKFGVKTLIDKSPGVQTYAPSGMFNQLHAGNSTGDELRTKPVRAMWNPTL